MLAVICVFIIQLVFRIGFFLFEVFMRIFSQSVLVILFTDDLQVCVDRC